MGSAFIIYMLDKHPGISIACLDSLTYAGNLANLSSLKDDPRFSFYLCDITDRDGVSEVFSEARPDAVVNFAAESHVDRSIEDPGLFVRTNVLGTEVLLDASLKAGVGRFHQISTDEVYGDLPLERPDLSFSEDSPLRPSSPYSASKAAADLIALSYYRTYSLPVTISRSSNNYGPRQFPEKLIPKMLANALQGLPLPVYGDGLNVRDWMHVDDHARAVDLILREGKPGEVYNVGARNEISNIDITKRLLSLLAKSEELITYVEDRKGHDRRYAINPGKLEALGWKSEVSFQAGLESTVSWYLAERDWWQDILSGEYRRRRSL